MSRDLMLKHVISKWGHLKFREKMLKCALGQMPEMEKEIVEWFIVKYFILIFIHQLLVHTKTNSTTHDAIHLFYIIEPWRLF